jgi:hypothetical protein
VKPLEQIASRTEIELAMLRELERRVRAMFSDFSGWDDDVDEDAAAAVHRVEQMLDWMQDTRKMMDDKPADQGGA